MNKQLSPDAMPNIRKALHDLAQPLAAVTGLIDLLMLEMDDADPRLKEVQTVSEQLEKVREIVSEIRRITREAAIAEPPSREPSAHLEVLGLK